MRFSSEELGVAMVETAMKVSLIAAVCMGAVAIAGAMVTKPMCDVQAMNQPVEGGYLDPFHFIGGAGTDLDPRCYVQYDNIIDSQNCFQWDNIWVCGQ